MASSSSGNSSSGLVTTWAKGLVFDDAGKVLSGFFDADRNLVDDASMGWAGVASSMLAWWQWYYGTTDYVSLAIPEDADDIFDQYRTYWDNTGELVFYSCHWWLDGETLPSSKVPAGTGAYYTRYYTPDNIDNTLFRMFFWRATPEDTGELLATYLHYGGTLGLYIAPLDRFNPHYVTLWGVTLDEETGYITSLHVSYPYDGKDEIFTVDVRYDEHAHYYKLVSNRFPTNYYLRSAEILTAAFNRDDTTAPDAPSGMSCRVKDEYVTLSWNGVQDSSDVIYEVQFNYYEDYPNCSPKFDDAFSTEATLTLRIEEAGSYYWYVRARDGVGNVTGWRYGGVFTTNVNLPVFSIDEAEKTRLKTGESRVDLTWYCSWKDVHFTLHLNDELVYTGNNGTYSSYYGSYVYKFQCVLADGEYSYTIRATDSAGHTYDNGGIFTLDTSTPLEPQNLKVSLEGDQATFSWQGMREEGDLAYSLYYWYPKQVNEPAYMWGITEESYTVTLHEQGEYNWYLIATDRFGNSSVRTEGTSFVYGLEFTLDEIEMVKSGAQTKVTFRWKSSADVHVKLVINGKEYDAGKKESCTVYLKDGAYDYLVVASDSSGCSTETRQGSFVCDVSVPETPTSLQVVWAGEDGLRMTFCWQAVADCVAYEVEYRRVGDTDYTSVRSESDSLTLALPEEGSYEWRVRAIDAAGNTSAWGAGESFVCDGTALQFTLAAPVQSRVGKNKTKVTFTWNCSADATYLLEINGTSESLGSSTSHTLTLPDGTYEYKLTATDSMGKRAVQAGSIVCDTIAPKAPSELRVEHTDGQAVLSWQAVEDASGVRYELEWRQQGAAAYTTESSETPHFTLPLAEESLYEWRLRAVDGLGQASAWVSGPGFSSDAAPPAISLAEPVQKRVGMGKTQVTLGWTASESATYTLEINGKCLSLGERHSYSLTLADGEYTYRLIATDASGNSSEVSGSVLCDATPPEPPQGLAVSAGRRNQLKFSWDEVADMSGVRYELVIRRPGGDEITQTLSGQTSYALTSPEDGRYHWSLRAVDGAGNASAWAEGGSFSYGDVPPAFTLLEPGQVKAGKGKQRVTLRWSGDAGLAYSLEVDGKAVAMDSDASSWTGVFTEGTHSYRLIARDALGKTAEQAGSFTCDQTAPELRLAAPSILRRADGGAEALFRWASNEAADYRLTIDGQEHSVEGGEHRLALAEGKHRYELVATDAAGNSSKAIKGKLTVDSIAPTLSLNPADIKAKRAREGVSKLTLKWKGERGATYLLKVDGEAVYEGRATSRTIELADGEHRYELIACDKAGNLSAPLGGSITTDASLPRLVVETPAITLQADGKGSALFAWNCDEAASYVLKVDGKVVTPDAQGRYVRDGLKRGKHSYVLTATDAAGNKTTAKGSFAVTTPDATLQAPVVAGTTASFAWTAEAGVDYSLKIGRETFSGLTGSYSYDAPKDGKYSYTLTAKDAAGNKATSKGSFVIDTKAPKLTLGKVKAKRAAEGRSEATLSWKGESKAHYVLTVDGERVYEGSDTRYTLKLMDQGVAHHYRVTATDAAGNSTTQEGTFTHDATAPGFLLSLPQAGERVKGRVSALFRWAGEADATCTLKVDGRKLAAGKGLTERKLMLKGGWHTLTIAAKDAAGNEASRSVEIYVDALTGGIRAAAPQATELAWQAEDTEGIAGQAGKVDLGVAEGLYRFELAGDGTLGIRLGGLTAAANLTLMASEGGELCTLRSLNASAGGLDRELALGAGTYYLQVSGTDGSKLAQGTPYLLDLELREGEKRQAALALA